jgi:phosphoglycolate phosphatase-like HAD superfamily hydrolase
MDIIAMIEAVLLDIDGTLLDNAAIYVDAADVAAHLDAILAPLAPS